MNKDAERAKAGNVFRNEHVKLSTRIVKMTVRPNGNRKTRRWLVKHQFNEHEESEVLSSPESILEHLGAEKINLAGEKSNG